MKTLRFFCRLVIGLATSTAALASSGHRLASGISFGGADRATIQHAWYYGSQSPIRVCIETKTSFAKSKIELGAIFEQASRIWQRYLKEKNLINTNLSPEQQLNSRFEIDSECQGRSDLILLVSDQLNEEVKSYFDNPISAAYRLNDEVGTIWLKNDKAFENDNYLLAILTHELGHTLGLNHNAQTIMDAGIVDFDSDLEVRIDMKRELSICSFCHIEKTHTLDAYESQLMMAAFAEMDLPADLSPKEIQFEILGKGKSRSSQPFYRLTFTSSGGETSHLEVHTGEVKYHFVQEVFVSRYDSEKLYNFTSTDYAYLSLGGKEYPVQVEYNVLNLPGQYRFSFITPRGKLIPFLDLP